MDISSETRFVWNYSAVGGDLRLYPVAQLAILAALVVRFGEGDLAGTWQRLCCGLSG